MATLEGDAKAKPPTLAENSGGGGPPAQPAPNPQAYNDYLAFQQAYYQQGQPPPGYYPPAGTPAQPHPYLWGSYPHNPPPPHYGAMYPPPSMYGHPQPYMYGLPSPTPEAPTVSQPHCPTLPIRSNPPTPHPPPPQALPAGTEDAPKIVMDGRGRKPKAGTVVTGVPRPGGGGGEEGAKLNGVTVANGVFSPSAGEDDEDDEDDDDDEDEDTPGQGKEYWDAGKKRRRGVGGSTLPPELWLQDEREVKRQRRKQSNRESARRSRLRKQAECEELATRVVALEDENGALKSELAQLSDQCRRLEAHNELLTNLARPEQITMPSMSTIPSILPDPEDVHKAVGEEVVARSVEV